MTYETSNMAELREWVPLLVRYDVYVSICTWSIREKSTKKMIEDDTSVVGAAARSNRDDANRKPSDPARDAEGSGDTGPVIGGGTLAFSKEVTHLDSIWIYSVNIQYCDWYICCVVVEKTQFKNKCIFLC